MARAVHNPKHRKLWALRIRMFFQSLLFPDSLNLLFNGWNPANKGERCRFSRIIRAAPFRLNLKGEEKKTEQVYICSGIVVSLRAGRMASALFELQVKGKGGASNDSVEA